MRKLWEAKQTVDLSHVGILSGIHPPGHEWHRCQFLKHDRRRTIHRIVGTSDWFYKDLDDFYWFVPYCPFCWERLPFE